MAGQAYNVVSQAALGKNYTMNRYSGNEIYDKANYGDRSQGRRDGCCVGREEVNHAR